MHDEIQILSEIQAVRQNPGMYIGSVCERGAHHLLNELVHNSVDEAMLGHCSRIQVTINDQLCEIRDNGRGVPTEMHSQEKISSLELALTRLHAGSKFNKEPGRFTAGQHGVGLSCVNALSSQLEITVHRGGEKFSQSYVRGSAQTPVRKEGQTSERGTSIQFSPDREIFRSFGGFHDEICKNFLEDIAYINPGLEIEFVDGAKARRTTFKNEERGLELLLAKYLQDRRALIPEPLSVSFSVRDLKFEARFTWTADTDSQIKSFVNSIDTQHGGTHVNAFRAGILRAVTVAMNEAVEIHEISEGLAAVIDCKVSHPNFEGQTKSRFTSADCGPDIEKLVAEQTRAFFGRHSQAAQIVFDRIREARHARMAARRIADRIYFQNVRHGIDEEVYKAQFGARSKNWHDSAVWITDQKLLQSHADMLKLDGGAVALDVCCGSGVVGASFKGKVKKIVGLDLTPEMVNLAKQRLDEVHQGNVYNIPFPDNSFDLVCTREVLHLLPFPEKPVSEIYRVLKPGGQFIVGQILPFGEDDAAWMYRVFKKKQPLIYNMFQEEDFRRLLLSPGFVDMEMTEMNVWESIDVWIDSVETTAVHRHEIRELFTNAPQEAKAIHPFKILPNGEIQDLWRWCVFSVRKPK